MGTLYVVATPIGNLKDISQNALNILESVDIIAAEDTRVTINLLRHYNIKTKLVSYHKYNEHTKSNTLIVDLQNDKNIAIVTDAGTPCISDPGSILVNEAIKNNIDVIAIPGASAVLASLMVSGFTLNSFTFYGFLSKENKEFNHELDTIKHDSSSVAIIYESPKRIINTLTKMQPFFDSSLFCVCNDLTKKFEKKYYGNIDSVIKELSNNVNNELGEYVIVIKKQETIKEDVKELTNEALLVDCMITNNVSLKEAISIVSSQNELSKKQVYEASLELKKLLLSIGNSR